MQIKARRKRGRILKISWKRSRRSKRRALRRTRINSPMLRINKKAAVSLKRKSRILRSSRGFISLL